MAIFIVPIHIPLRLRPSPGTDELVDFRQLFHREPFAEMHQHGRVKQQLAFASFILPHFLCYGFVFCNFSSFSLYFRWPLFVI